MKPATLEVFQDAKYSGQRNITHLRYLRWASYYEGKIRHRSISQTDNPQLFHLRQLPVASFIEIYEVSELLSTISRLQLYDGELWKLAESFAGLTLGQSEVLACKVLIIFWGSHSKNDNKKFKFPRNCAFSKVADFKLRVNGLNSNRHILANVHKWPTDYF